MSNTMVDTGCANTDPEWSSIIQQAGKAITLLSSMRNLAQDEEEYAKFLLSIVGYIRICLERTAKKRGVKQRECDISGLEDYRKTAISFLLQLESKLDPEGSYDQNVPAGLTPSWKLTSDHVTHFVVLADQLDHKWDHWWCSVHAEE